VKPTTAAALALSLALAGAAGCLAEDEAAPAALSGVEAVELALGEARNWSADAELVLLSGVEAGGEHPATEREDDQLPKAPADDEVGDGRAPAWTALFHSASENATQSVRVVGGEATGLDPAPVDEPPTAVGEWSVDSPDAVGSAMGQADFREQALASGATVSLVLGVEDAEPRWRVTASGSSGAHTERVHAGNGTLVG